MIVQTVFLKGKTITNLEACRKLLRQTPNSKEKTIKDIILKIDEILELERSKKIENMEVWDRGIATAIMDINNRKNIKNILWKLNNGIIQDRFKKFISESESDEKENNLFIFLENIDLEKIIELMHIITELQLNNLIIYMGDIKRRQTSNSNIITWKQKIIKDYWLWTENLRILIDRLNKWEISVLN